MGERGSRSVSRWGVDTAPFGHAELGSFVLTMECAVAPGLQASLHDALLATERAARVRGVGEPSCALPGAARIVRTLVRGTATRP